MRLGPAALAGWIDHFDFWAHRNQLPPDGEVAHLADDGRARVRQDARRRGMDPPAGNGRAGMRIALVGATHRRCAKHHGRRRERAVDASPGVTGASCAWEPSVEPAELAQRQRGAAVFGRPCRRAARAGTRFRLVRRTGQMAAGRRGVGQFAMGAAARLPAARAGDDDAAADAAAERDGGGPATITTRGRTSDNINLDERVRSR